MVKNFINRLNIKDYLVLFIILSLGYWQITLFQNIMKWDILDINLPWRYFVSECLQNGILPLWNPYINCGFPQSADPMTWYPISWLIGFFFGNNLITIQYEYLFHIFIGGIGIYKLGGLFNFNRETKLITSISFIFSGLFISNAQHLGWIVSAAWFPLIIYQYILFSKNLSLKNGVIFVLFLFFQLTGGYAGFFIITGYVLAIICTNFIVRYWKEKKLLKKYLFLNLVITISFILLSSVVLVSSLQISTLLTRYNQISIDYVTVGALPFKALLSFILPFATTTNPEFWGTDLTLLNCYIGIIPLVFIFYSLLVIRKRNIRILFLFGTLLLTISLANIFPFREWLYYLPFMNIFRFPTIFRFFTYVVFILVSGVGLNHFLKEKGNENTLQIIIIVTLVLLGGIFIYNAFFIEKWIFKSLFLFEIKTFLNEATIHDRIFLQAFISIIILTTLLVTLKKFADKRRNVIFIFLVVFDMIAATQLNIYHTVVDYTNPKATQQKINNLPDGFPIPDIHEKILDINDLNTEPIPFLWRNLNIFYKKTSYTGYSPYYFSSMQKCEEEGLFHSVIKNPLFYLADSISSNQIIDSLSIDTLSSRKIRLIAFNPNHVELKVHTGNKQLLTFVQNYYPGWKAYVNDTEIKIIPSNYTFMSLWVPKGESKVIFEYKPKNVLIAFYVSAITLVFIITFLGIQVILKYRYNKN